MTLNAYLQLILYMVVLIALAKPLGWYMARVYEGQSVGLDRVLGPLTPLGGLVPMFLLQMGEVIIVGALTTFSISK